MLSANQLAAYHSAKQWWVALSGGVDSVVLLHALLNYRQHHNLDLPIRAIHIDHQLQAGSAAWRDFCLRLCKALDIECRVVTLQDKPDLGQSIEAWARQARYDAFAALLQPNDCVFTAHHKSDQVETLLLQLSRGAGPYGLAGMPVEKKLGEGQIVRPLLECSRADIESYAQQHQLQWCEDPSNVDQRFDRNFLRNTVVPQLKQRWPSIETTIARSARLMAESTQLLDELAQADLQQLLNDSVVCISIAKLQQLSLVRQRHVLRYWLRQRDLPVPSEAQMQQLMDHVIAASRNAQPLVHWSHDGINVEVRRYRDGLYIAKPCKQSLSGPLRRNWQLHEPLVITEKISMLAAELFSQQDLQQLQAKRIEARWQCTGSSIKKLFQSHSIPPWWRHLMPVIFVDGQRFSRVRYSVLLQRLSYYLRA